MSIREIHWAELSAILREYLTAVDMPIDVLVGLQKVEEFFQAHPEYLSCPKMPGFFGSSVRNCLRSDTTLLIRVSLRLGEQSSHPNEFVELRSWMS